MSITSCCNCTAVTDQSPDEDDDRDKEGEDDDVGDVEEEREKPPPSSPTPEKRAESAGEETEDVGLLSVLSNLHQQEDMTTE